MFELYATISTYSRSIHIFSLFSPYEVTASIQIAKWVGKPHDDDVSNEGEEREQKGATNGHPRSTRQEPVGHERRGQERPQDAAEKSLHSADRQRDRRLAGLGRRRG